MLLDEVDDRLGQVVLAREVGAVFHVGDDHQRAHRGDERIVPVVALGLVLDEILRLEHLADVVEVRPHAHQQAAGADRFGRRLGERRHGDRVVVRARRRRISSCNSGWAGSPSSIRLRSVCTPNTFSTVGSSTVMSEPAITDHRATVKPLLQQRRQCLAVERADAERREESDRRGREADQQQLAARAHLPQHEHGAGDRRAPHQRLRHRVAERDHHDQRHARRQQAAPFPAGTRPR